VTHRLQAQQTSSKVPANEAFLGICFSEKQRQSKNKGKRANTRQGGYIMPSWASLAVFVAILAPQSKEILQFARIGDEIKLPTESSPYTQKKRCCHCCIEHLMNIVFTYNDVSSLSEIKSMLILPEYICM
jgi:hypothetical protein